MKGTAIRIWKLLEINVQNALGYFGGRAYFGAERD